MLRANPVVMVGLPVILGAVTKSIDYSNPVSPSFWIANHGRERMKCERWFIYTTRSAVIALVQSTILISIYLTDKWHYHSSPQHIFSLTCCRFVYS